MTRFKISVTLSACLFAVFFLLGMSDPAPTQAPPAPEKGKLSLNRVMLSSGGVGYFEYQAQVQGTEDLELSVRLDQVDDVLKSIVIYDDKGGAGTINLPSRAPLSEIFRDLPFDANAMGSLFGVLRALKGAEIEVSGSKTLTGRIVSVEKEKVIEDNIAKTHRTRVTLMSSKGLQQFYAEEATHISFTDKELDAEVQRVLEQVAERSAQDTRTLTIHTEGEGARILTVGYVVEAPLWKSSYRLILPSENGELPDQKARLQGWSILENASGQDWQEVELTILAGNPVTFRQAIYANYYVDRPEVPLEVMSQAVPNMDEGELEERDLRKVEAAETTMSGMLQKAKKERLEEAREAPSSRSYYGGGIDEVVVAPQKRMASSHESNAQLSFTIKEKVSVEDGQTLLVPIIDRNIPAERVAWFPTEYYEDQPLAAVSLKNDSESSLPPGVITVYEANGEGDRASIAFLGDARLSILPKGEERMVAYALDTKVTATIDEKGSESQFSTFKIVNGFLETKSIRKTTYTIVLKAPKEEDRLIVFELDKDLEGKFLPPKGASVSRTSDAFRIRMPVKAGDALEADAVFEMPQRRSVHLTSIIATQLAFYAENAALSEQQREIFSQMAKIKSQAVEQNRLLRSLKARRTSIFKEQERIRENLKALTDNSAIKQRYLRSLDKQESELENITEDEKAAKKAMDAANEELRRFVEALDL